MLEIPLGTLGPDGVTVRYPPSLLVLAGTAVTATTAATAISIGTLTRNYRLLAIMSSCASPVVVTLGPTLATGIAMFQLETGNAVVVDGDMNGLRFSKGLVLGAYNTAGAPASGTLRVTLL